MGEPAAWIGHRRAAGPGSSDSVPGVLGVTATLTEFLLARIAEDEALVRAVLDEQGSDTSWTTSDGWEHNHLSNPTSQWQRHHSPERALAECEAKRCLIAYGQSALDAFAETRLGIEGGLYAVTMEFTLALPLRLMAQVYADHPDYCEEWRP